MKRFEKLKWKLLEVFLMNKQVLNKLDIKTIIEDNYDVGNIKKIEQILEGASSES